MKYIATLSTLAALILSGPVFARDNLHTLSIKDALEAPAAVEKLDKGVKLYFAGQTHPRVIKELGEYPTSKKTNAFNKTSVEACNWAFLSAMLSLQERASKEGGNAVINIKSNYRNTETSSPTEYVCGDGTFVSGVAFKGTVAKIAE